MTNGRISSTRIPYLPISVEIPERHLTAEFMALVDTGFNAEVVVPQVAVDDEGPALLEADVRLARALRFPAIWAIFALAK